MEKFLKVAGLGFVTFLVAAFVFYTRGGWTSRGRALTGAYHASGVWGHSTLILSADHTCIQDVQFMVYDEPEHPPFPQHPADHKVISCHWREGIREGLGRRVAIDSIIGLAPWDNEKLIRPAEFTYGPVMFAGYGIEVDSGADIVYWKMRDKDCVETSFREPCARAFD